MKKVVMLLTLFVSAFIAKADLYITNYTNCDFTIVVKAHNNANNTFCALTSNSFTLTSMNYVQYADVASLNTTPGWVGGPFSGTGSFWDAVQFTAIPSGIGSMVGYYHPANCTAAQTYTSPSNGCSGAYTVDWTIIGSDTFVDIY